MRGKTAVCLLALLAVGRDGRGQAARPAVGPSTAGRRASAARLADPQEVRARLGLLADFADVPAVASIRVAVLDSGFAGLESGRPYLPRNAEVVEHYDPAFVRRYSLGDPEYRKGFEPGNAHGRQMAEIVWAVTGSRPSGPKFYLLNANGPTMLRRAVRYAIERRVDVILFSGVFEGGGSGDGRGPINRIVADALAANILWVNSAGNFGHRVYEGPVRVLSDGYLRLRDGSDIASLRFRNRVDENTLTVTLTWNDYREAEDAGTDKDLDLYVEDWAGRRLGAGEKVQVSGAKASGPNESRNPRERVVLADLAAGPDVPADPDYTYRIRIRAKRGRFGAGDRLRVLLTAARETYMPPGASAPRPAFEFLDASGRSELYPPADNPLVLTVGDAEPGSSVGPTADGRVKPDAIVRDSRAYFTDGEVTAGSSNAAAYVAGVAALLRGVEPGLRASHLLRVAQGGGLLRRPAAAGAGAALASGTVAGVGGAASVRPLVAGPSGLSATAYRAVAPASSSTGPDLHLWQTPTRARLRTLVRDGR